MEEGLVHFQLCQGVIERGISPLQTLGGGGLVKGQRLGAGSNGRW